MSRQIALIIALISLLFLQAGCAAYKTYPGKKLPKSDVALLAVPWANIILDGSLIPNKYVSNIELLPGPHVIEWDYIHTNDYRELKQLKFVVEANHQYTLGQRFFPEFGLGGAIGLVADIAVDTALLPLKLLIEEKESTESPKGEYYMWITDRDTQQIVAGMAPNTVQGHQEITYVPIDMP